MNIYHHTEYLGVQLLGSNCFPSRGLNTSVFYVKRDQNVTAFGAMIGRLQWTNQSEQHMFNINQTRTKPSDDKFLCHFRIKITMV